MANAVNTHILQDGSRNLVILLTGALDTSNESAVAKIDVSTLTPAAVGVVVDEIQYSVSGSLKAILAWDATTDVTFATLAGQGTMCFDHIGGLKNNAGSGKTGDVMLSTVGWASGTETYTILIRARKVY